MGISKETLINSAVRGEVLSLPKGQTMNGKHRKIITLRTEPFDKLRANGVNQSFPNKPARSRVIVKSGYCQIWVSTLEMIFCAFCRKLFREGTYLVVYPG